MKIFTKYKFLNRFARIPRTIFTSSKGLNLSMSELDAIFKLLNFDINNTNITPNLTLLSERAGTSIRTFQRAFSKLKEKELLSIEQLKNNEGKFWTNSYNLSWLISKIELLSSNQLAFQFDSEGAFWAESSLLYTQWFIAVPKTLDFFQKELDLDTKEIIFLKYLLWFIDDSWIAEISLNYTSKTTPLTRRSLQRIINTLTEKKLIIIKEQYHWRSKIRTRNRYDIKPLLWKLNQLEKKKVENKLIEQWKWKDYKREYKSINNTYNPSIPKSKPKVVNKERVLFLENEIRRLQPELLSKYSETAELIRGYQSELSLLKHSTVDNSIWTLIWDRFKMLSKSREKPRRVEEECPEHVIKAKFICDKLRWNWNKSSNFYIKSVLLLPNTVDRFVSTAYEKALKKECYFTTSVSKEFRKLKLVNS